MVVKKAETGDLKSKISDSLKKMKTSTTKDKTVNDIVDEVMKRGRTDNAVKNQKVDEKPKGMKESKKSTNKKIISEAEEEDEKIEHEDEEADKANDHEEPDGDELETGEEPTDVEGEEVPEEGTDEPAFDVEEDYENLEGEEESTSDDIDEIISNLLQTEEIEVDVDAEKGTVKISDKAETEDRGVEAVKGDIELIGDEELEGEEDLPVEEEMEADIDSAIEEEKTVKGQLDEMLATFGKAYPKIFNESMISKLQLIVEMYTNAKAKKQATQKIKTVVESVDVYMNRLEKAFKKENQKKLAEAIDNTKKVKLLSDVKNLLEAKLGKATTQKTNKNVETALKALYNENIELRNKVNTLRESNFVYKTNMLFESMTKELSANEKKLITKLIEGVDFKNTKEFSLRLGSAIEVVKNMSNEKKTLKESVEKKEKTKEHFVKKERPVRRSDNFLTTEMIKEQIKNRKAKILTEDVDNDEEGGDIDFDEMDKYIPQN